MFNSRIHGDKYDAVQEKKKTQCILLTQTFKYLECSVQMYIIYRYIHMYMKNDWKKFFQN